ncbi:hypothetical protein [Actinoplanes friuliensis]|nr:hypothetical protein [Actinoplanes friuliensis]
MAEPAVPTTAPRLELPLAEARTRFVQLARLAGLTRQTTVVTDKGRPLAAIVPIPAPAAPSPSARAPGPTGASGLVGVPHRAGAASPARSLAPAAEPARERASEQSAAGWIRRIETLRADLRRQHAGLEQALDQAWHELDKLSPPGTDAQLDALRTAHADLRTGRTRP